MLEMGATWRMSLDFVPVCVPSYSISNLDDILKRAQGFAINDSEGLSSLKVQLDDFFDLPKPLDAADWDRIRGKFLRDLE